MESNRGDNMLSFREAKLNEMGELYRLRYRSYCETKKFLPTENYPNGMESDSLDPFSVHFVALNGSNAEITSLVGGFRLIRSNPLGFPCEQTFKFDIPASRPEQRVELSRFVIAPDSRPMWMAILEGLCREIYRYSTSSSVLYCYAVMEDNLLKLLTRLGLPFEKLGEGKWHMGAVTYPTVLSMKVLEAVTPVNNAMFWTYLNAQSEEQPSWL